MKYFAQNFLNAVFAAAIVCLQAGAAKGQVTKTNQVTNTQDELTDLLNQNYIINDSALLPFYQQLYAGRKNNNLSASILHAGDSHVQMGYWVEQMRKGFAENWEIRGLGTTFPYQIAHYNPFYTSSTTSVGWKGSNYLYQSTGLDFGISGFTAATSLDTAILTVSIKNAQIECRQFNQVTIWYRDSLDQYQLKLDNNAGIMGNSITTEQNKIHGTTTIDSGWSKKIFVFDSLQDQIKLTIQKPGSSQGRFLLYNLLFEKTGKVGLLYHNAGVGGAQFFHLCTNATLATTQITSLDPDLLILSYGSNESYRKDFDTAAYRQMVVSFIKKIKAAAPRTTILLTTPPDTRARNTYPRNTYSIVAILKKIAIENNVACWDFHAIMGGDGSVYKWLRLKLASSDKLHLTRNGYDLQAKLLLYALFNSYNRFVMEDGRVSLTPFVTSIENSYPTKKNLMAAPVITLPKYPSYSKKKVQPKKSK